MLNRTIQFAFINFLWLFILIIGWYGGYGFSFIPSWGFGIVIKIIWWIFIAVLITMVGYKLYIPYFEYNVILANEKFDWKTRIKKYIRIQSFGINITRRDRTMEDGI